MSGSIRVMSISRRYSGLEIHHKATFDRLYRYFQSNCKPFPLYVLQVPLRLRLHAIFGTYNFIITICTLNFDFLADTSVTVQIEKTVGATVSPRSCSEIRIWATRRSLLLLLCNVCRSVVTYLQQR